MLPETGQTRFRVNCEVLIGVVQGKKNRDFAAGEYGFASRFSVIYSKIMNLTRVESNVGMFEEVVFNLGEVGFG